MRALIPRTGLTGLRRDMERLLDHFWDLDVVEPRALEEWVPALDLSETREKVVVKAEVPGLEAKDIQIELEDQTLTIRGERRREKEEKDERFHRVERTYGGFSRSIRLPAAVDASRVDARFKNGLLTVTLIKTSQPKGTAISIKAD